MNIAAQQIWCDVSASRAVFRIIGLGVATRAAPSLNIFSVGFPAMIFAGFAILILALPSIGARIQWLWMQGFFQVRTLVGLS